MGSTEPLADAINAIRATERLRAIATTIDQAIRQLPAVLAAEPKLEPEVAAMTAGLQTILEAAEAAATTLIVLLELGDERP